MDNLVTFAERISTRLSSVRKDDFFFKGLRLPVQSVIANRLSLRSLAEELAVILGKDNVAKFFGARPPGLAGVLVDLLFHNCFTPNRESMSLNKEAFIDGLAQVSECVRQGEMEYRIMLRLVNFNIKNDFRLGEALIRTLPKKEIQRKYPINREYEAVSSMVERHWLNHRVEAVFTRKGTPADMSRDCSIETFDALERSITHAFVLSGVVEGNIPHVTNIPYVTHIMLDSPIWQIRHIHRAVSSLISQPESLSTEAVERLRVAQRVLQNAEKDRILQMAIDRFIVGKKREIHHPNRTNQPNWDKVVDYVIAMESLFLTINGTAVDNEPSYRFRLNGSSLLSQSCDVERRRALDALKNLYELRSRVVHGGNDSAILKAADKFIDVLGIDDTSHKHPLGRLILVCRQVEEWLRRMILHLAEVPIAKRPYKKQGAWEDMLWNSPDAANPAR